jgi:hypothetical protein
MLIEGAFDPRALANMNIALDRVCEKAADGEKHPVRKRVAKQIIKCARRQDDAGRSDGGRQARPY